MENKENPAPPSNNDLINSLKISSSSVFTSRLIIGFFIVIALGVGTGFVLGKKGASVSTNTSGGSVTSSSESKEIVGSADTKTFRDTATGTLNTGGINGEGAYHLVRPGGASQNVYLTSSVIDLSAFVGKKVTVWGETQKAQTAGWLMDVGRVEVLK